MGIRGAYKVDKVFSIGEFLITYELNGFRDKFEIQKRRSYRVTVYGPWSMVHGPKPPLV